jgi:glutathione S-transferase
MKAPDYLAINSMAKVPAIRHGATIVTECAAICGYLADAFPEAARAPLPAERGASYRWLFFTAWPLEAAVTARALHVEPSPEQQALIRFGTSGGRLRRLPPRLVMQVGTIPERPVFRDFAAPLHARRAAQRANQLDDAAISAAPN